MAGNKQKSFISKPITEPTREDEIEVVKDAKPQADPKRVYTKSVDHPQDEFKLELANMIKDSSFLPNSKPELKKVEHCHFFYTTDRRGQKLTECTATGGHKHQVKTWIDDDGEFHGECGPPIAHNGTVFIGPKNAKGVQQSHPKYDPDTHTHKTTYQKSAIVSKNRAKAKAKEIMAFAETENAKA